MKDQNKLTWLQTLIALGALLATILLYFLIQEKKLDDQNGWKLVLDVLPDLIATLLTVIVLYFIFIRQGISSHSLLVDEIVSRVKSNTGVVKFEAQSIVDRKFEIKDEIKKAKKIQVIGYSCRYLIAGLRFEFKEAILNNTSFEFILIKPKSDASKLLMENQKFKEIEVDLEDAISRIEEIKKDVDLDKRKRKGKVEVKFLNWIPSSSMIIITPKKKNDPKIIKLKVYAPDNATPLTKIKTHMLFNESEDGELFSYFEGQFNSLWHRSK